MITQSQPNIKWSLQNVIEIAQEKCGSFGGVFMAERCPRKLHDCWPVDECVVPAEKIKDECTR